MIKLWQEALKFLNKWCPLSEDGGHDRSGFVYRVIDDLDNGRYLKTHERSTYFDPNFIMDQDSDKRSCAIDDGWAITTDKYIFRTIRLRRGNYNIPLTKSESRDLIRATLGAIDNIKLDRKKFLDSLRD